ncbi:hypothetical protein FHR24_000803 [Wenyingzhuangia heitensis]|uniref:Starch-binding associating with outer membrane n=1 Tax=Wenyingzhuangia heitensis TaxID=1487859 RepID=A0ABX0U7Q4_9FLAO|nr:SusD/RagB family nutrient-binding outer membrane lipoprotein [Wenyingzhuangia heitensis]NIJ44364.1 hypothetical protein [Wenyingzhuangia heitensis]
MFKNIYYLVTASILLFSCTNDFEEINDNPNAPVNVDAPYLLSSVVLNTAYDLTSENMKGLMGIPCRYITRADNSVRDNFKWDEENWDYVFKVLIDNEDLLNKAINENNMHLQAVALIVKGYLFGTLTDGYGQVPFKDALNAENEDYTAVYSNQETIYNAVLDYFDQANTLLSQEGILVQFKDFDPMFGGDALKWRKLANSLRLRYLLRLSNKKSDAVSQIQTLVNNSTEYPLILNNEDNAKVPYLGVKDSDSSPFGSFDGDFEKRRPSKVLVDFLLERNDPRLPVWIREVADPAAGTITNDAYVGLPLATSGLPTYNGTTNYEKYETSNMSEFNAVFHDDENELFAAVIFQASEMYFNLAELVLNHGLTYEGKTVEALYLKGIETSMEQYQVATKATADSYYSQAKVSYNGTLEQIMEQKWVSLIFVGGAEAWFDHRRTGFPDFPIGSMAIEDSFPTRLPYPASEGSYNAENYQNAIDAQGWANDDNYELMWLLK